MMKCIQIYGVAKNERDLDNVVVSLRLRGAEAVRFWIIMDKAKEKDHYADRTDVLRELLRLDPLELLTEHDIAFFRTGEKAIDVIFVPKPVKQNAKNTAKKKA